MKKITILLSAIMCASAVYGKNKKMAAFCILCAFTVKKINQLKRHIV